MCLLNIKMADEASSNIMLEEEFFDNSDDGPNYVPNSNDIESSGKHKTMHIIIKLCNNVGILGNGFINISGLGMSGTTSFLLNKSMIKQYVTVFVIV